MTVKDYGSSYAVLASTSRVSIDAELIDLRSGARLWAGHKELAQSSGGGGLIGMLVNVVVSQIVNHLSDQSHGVAETTDILQLLAGQQGGILYGPWSPKYELH